MRGGEGGGRCHTTIVMCSCAHPIWPKFKFRNILFLLQVEELVSRLEGGNPNHMVTEVRGPGGRAAVL